MAQCCTLALCIQWRNKRHDDDVCQNEYCTAIEPLAQGQTISDEFRLAKKISISEPVKMFYRGRLEC